MLISYKKLTAFLQVALLRIQLEKKENTETKLCSVLFELIGNESTFTVGTLKPVFDEYERKKKQLARFYASTDERGIIIKDQHQNYCFTKETEAQLEVELEKLENELVEITPIFCNDLPKNITQAEIKHYIDICCVTNFSEAKSFSIVAGDGSENQITAHAISKINDQMLI